MANDCFYEMTVVGPRENVERLISIMNYDDKEYYLYRVFEVSDPDFYENGSGRCAATFHGYVAWSAQRWVAPVDDKDHEIAWNGAHYTNLLELSGILGLSIAVTTEESGMGFCEFYHIYDGRLIEEEVGEYESLWFDSKEGYDQVRDIVTSSAMLTPEEKKEILGHMDEIGFDDEGHGDHEFIIDIGGWEHDFRPEDVDSENPLDPAVQSYHSETFPL